MKNTEGNPQWYFPTINGGLFMGDSSSPQDGHKNKKLKALIEECCQNSMDASADYNRPVEIVFKQFEMNVADIPGIEDLKRHIEFCCASTIERNTELFTQAKKALAKDRISCLRISDFNTTGLCGSRQKDGSGNKTQWFSCVRSQGPSGAKKESSGGSKGQGKATLYINSTIKTVFFSTADADGLCASEGVATLPSHAGTLQDKHTEYSGIGYYSCNRDEQPSRAIYSQTSLDPDYKRDSSCHGTDIFVLGFDAADDEDLDYIFRISIVERYLLAIADGKIDIQYKDMRINKNTLPDYISSISKMLNIMKPGPFRTEAERCVAVYNLLTSSEDEVEKVTLPIDENDINGRLDLTLRIGGNTKFASIYRQIGMKIMHKTFKTTTAKYSALLVIKGDSLNRFMKNMEDATHTKWIKEEYTDKENRRTATAIINSIETFIKDSVNKLSTSGTDEIIDSGLSQFLGSTADFSNEEIDKDGFILNDYDDKTESDFLRVDTQQTINENMILDNDEDEANESLVKNKDGDHTQKAYGWQGLKRRKRRQTPTVDSKSRNEGGSGDYPIDQNYKKLSLIAADIKILGDYSYKKITIIIMPSINKSNILLELNVAAEYGNLRLFKPEIESAYDKNNHPLECKGNTVLGLRLRKNKKIKLSITLKNNVFNTFEGSLYAYQPK